MPQPSSSTGVLRFATYLAPNMEPVYRFLAAYAGERIGVTTELVVGRSFGQFQSGEVDVGFLWGLPYVRLVRRDPPSIELLVAPVLMGERYRGEPIYFSDVIVRQSSPALSFTDLRGRSWAYNDRDSHSGYNLTRYELIRRGETSGFFSRVIEGGSHQRCMRLVAEGVADGAAIDSQVLAVELREHPDLSKQLRVVDAFGPSTIQPVVAASRLPAALKTSLREVLLHLHEDPAARKALAYGFVERFVEVGDARYDDIREMLSAAERSGFLEIA